MGWSKAWLLTALMILVVGHAQAEYLGLPNARSANPGVYPDITVEFGFVSGDLGSQDYQNIAARLNYRLSDHTVLFGNVGISEFGIGDANPFGVGIFYYLSNQRIARSLDIAVKASYHTGNYEFSNVDLDVNVIALEALISSPSPILNNGLSWYGNFGLHHLSEDPGGSDLEFGFGGGFYMPLGSGEAFFGADVVDQFTFGLGYRYFLK